MNTEILTCSAALLVKVLHRFTERVVDHKSNIWLIYSHTKGYCCYNNLNRGSYISAHVLLKLLNELGKRDKIRGLPSILSIFRNEFNKFNNTKARMLDSIYHVH